MSSAVYEAALTPARSLRLTLLAAAVLASVTGTVLILALPVVPLLKGALCLLWLSAGAAEVATLRRGMSRIGRIGIRADGRIAGYGPGGGRHELELLPGSVVLERVAWLRLAFGDGLAYGELLAGDPSTSEAWRRFLVIWRHRGSLGRFGRS